MTTNPPASSPTSSTSRGLRSAPGQKQPLCTFRNFIKKILVNFPFVFSLSFSSLLCVCLSLSLSGFFIIPLSFYFYSSSISIFWLFVFYIQIKFVPLLTLMDEQQFQISISYFSLVGLVMFCLFYTSICFNSLDSILQNVFGENKCSERSIEV